MFLLTPLLLSCLSALAHASPSPATKYKTASFNATFDDLPNPGVLGQSEGLPVPAGYKLLAWPGFNYGVPAGYNAKSGNMSAFSDVATRLLGGVVNGTIRTSYTGSKTVAFDLNEFYFGCAAEDTSGVSVAIACTIEVTGFRGAQFVARQYFTAVPPALEGDSMVRADLGSGFLALTNASIAVVVSNATPLLTVMPMDNVIGKVYYTS